MLLEEGYDWVEKWDYKETLSLCSDGACIYYYEASVDENRFYFDKDGKTLSDGIELAISGSNYGLTPIAEQNAVDVWGERDSFRATHIVGLRDELNFGMEGFEARIIDTYQDLVIYETYSDDTQQINYGLAYQEGTYSILAPSFEMIEFDTNSDQVKLTYKDKEYVFPISRYTK